MEQYNKIDFLIIIVLSLLVAFIIGFNIIKVIDEKLTNVVINVPPQNCAIPPIYLSIDKDSNIKQIKLNDYINPNGNKVRTLAPKTVQKTNGTIQIDNFDDISNGPEGLDDSISEPFGNLNDYPAHQSNPNTISGLISTRVAEDLINKPGLYDIIQDPNFNNLNNIPVLISPDPPGPNQVPATAPSQYENRVKLVDNPESPLLKVAQDNYEKLAQKASSCNIATRNAVPEVNGTFDGFNAFVDLKTDSYANFSSIGKGLLTPYSSFPVPS